MFKLRLKTYAFGILPLAALVSLSSINPLSNSKSTKPAALPRSVESGAAAFDLPCGFTAQGPHQQPEKPSFTTSDDIPVLQYPAGRYAQTNISVPDAINSERVTDELVLQGDGNLVIYCISCSPAKAIWSSQTAGKKCKTLFFQTDGELVLKNENNKIVWRSNIRSKCPGSERAYFTLQDDGNLAMLYDEKAAAGVIKQNTQPADGPSASAPGSKSKGNDNAGVYTYYIAGTTSTNDQPSTHLGKIQ
jgi:hypothetical protein